MQRLKKALLEEQKRLKDIIHKAKTENVDMPEGHLRISKHKDRCRYYHCTGDRNGTYISKKNRVLIKQLAQKSYNESIINEAEEQLARINKIVEIDAEEKMKKLYDSMHPDRKKWVVPIEETWEQKLQKWYETPYQGKEFREGTPVILTEKGERVRSKSEKILADYFYRKNILYLYEKPLYLKGYGTVYPDFTFLSPKTGQEIYWEHEGMMDNREYARNAVKKIESYQKNRIYPGECLILTFETEQSILNQTIMENIVEKYLLPGKEENSHLSLENS